MRLRRDEDLRRGVARRGEDAAGEQESGDG
jgi:hypothetical protein